MKSAKDFGCIMNLGPGFVRRFYGEKLAGWQGESNSGYLDFIGHTEPKTYPLLKRVACRNGHSTVDCDLHPKGWGKNCSYFQGADAGGTWSDIAHVAQLAPGLRPQNLNPTIAGPVLDNSLIFSHEQAYHRENVQLRKRFPVMTCQQEEEFRGHLNQEVTAEGGGLALWGGIRDVLLGDSKRLLAWIPQLAQNLNFEDFLAASESWEMPVELRAKYFLACQLWTSVPLMNEYLIKKEETRPRNLSSNARRWNLEHTPQWCHLQRFRAHNCLWTSTWFRTLPACNFPKLPAAVTRTLPQDRTWRLLHLQQKAVGIWRTWQLHSPNSTFWES